MQFCFIFNLDKPGPPGAPLSVSDIGKDNCLLSWKPPKDDGGSEILYYLIEKMDVRRGTWSEVGQRSELTTKVTKLTEGKEYMFRVKAVNGQGESEALETEKAITVKLPYGESPQTDCVLCTIHHISHCLNMMTTR